MRLLLRNHAPILALVPRTFYPAVAVTPLSSKLPQPLLLFSSAVIRRAVPQQTLYESACFCAIAPQHLMPQLVRTCFGHILPRSGSRASVLLPQLMLLLTSAVICRCNPLLRRIMHFASVLASMQSRPNPCTCFTRILPRSRCHASVLLP